MTRERRKRERDYVSLGAILLMGMLDFLSESSESSNPQMTTRPPQAQHGVSHGPS